MTVIAVAVIIPATTGVEPSPWIVIVTPATTEHAVLFVLLVGATAAAENLSHLLRR